MWSAQNDGMILIASIIASAVAALTIVIVQLRKAPIGYEDATGFHIMARIKSSAVLRYRKPKQPVTAGLESAEVRS